jgi:hypothetical protein
MTSVTDAAVIKTFSLAEMYNLFWALCLLFWMSVVSYPQATLLHWKPACAGKFCDSYHVQGHKRDNTDMVLLNDTTGYMFVLHHTLF